MEKGLEIEWEQKYIHTYLENTTCVLRDYQRIQNEKSGINVLFVS